MLNCVFVTVGYPSPQHPERCTFTHRMVRELSSHMGVHVIHLRALRPGIPLIEKRELDGIPIHSLAIPQIPSWGAQRLNAQLLTGFGKYLVRSLIEQADIIHTSAVFPTGYLGTRWSRLYRKPHVTQAMGDDVNIELGNPKISGEDKSWLMELDGVACNSRELYLKLLQIMPGIPNVKVIHRGVDTVVYTPRGPIEGPQAGLSPVRYFFLGGFQTWNPKYDHYNTKGGSILLQAWKKVELVIGNSSLLVAGPGTNAAKLEPWLSSLQRREAVFTMASVLPARVPNLLRACDVVIVPSLNEGLPNIANEAQASARPVLGSNAGGIPETVLHGNTGRIVRKGDVNQLAEEIVWFSDHQEQIAEIGNRARQHMIDDFSWERAAREMIELFQAAIQHYNAVHNSPGQ